MTTKNISLDLLETNDGQIEGVNKNPRDLTKEGFDKALISIKEFPDMLSVRELVVVANNNKFVVIGGNQRLRALRELKYLEAPCKIVAWTPQQINEFIIKDNVSYGEWDFELLANEWDLPQLENWGLDLPEFNVDNEKVEGLTDPDEVPEVPIEPVAKLGDLWILGEHRLMCGDATIITDVEKLMNGKKADMVFTDPPYGMFLDAEGFAKMPKAKGTTAKNYTNIIGDNEDFTPELINTIFASFDYCKEIFLWGADYYSDLIPKKNDGSWIVWDKRQDGGFDNLFGSSFELCWSKNKHKRDIARILWAGYFGMSGEDSKIRIHPTKKPTALVEWFFDKWGCQNDIVVDLFGGSGSSLIACEKTNRKCYMMELDPKYVDVIINRWQNFTGKGAISVSTGQKFKDILNLT